MKKQMLTFIVLIILINAGLADSVDILPWKMTWDTSVQDYVGLLQTNLPGFGHRIWGARGEYCVDAEGDQGKYRLSCRAVLKGKKATNSIAEYQLQDIENMNLQLDWVCIDYEPLSLGNDNKNLDNGNVMKAYLALYEEFAGTYGQGASDGSYIETGTWDVKRAYALPQRDGNIDFNAITEHQRQYLMDMENSEHYWLVIGNGYASCRLYVSCRDGVDEKRDVLWRISYYFTKDSHAVVHGKEALP